VEVPFFWPVTLLRTTRTFNNLRVGCVCDEADPKWYTGQMRLSQVKQDKNNLLVSLCVPPHPVIGRFPRAALQLKTVTLFLRLTTKTHSDRPHDRDIAMVTDDDQLRLVDGDEGRERPVRDPASGAAAVAHERQGRLRRMRRVVFGAGCLVSFVLGALFDITILRRRWSGERLCSCVRGWTFCA
jgi:hypothetical protein